jgi:acyl carrier protein
LRAVGDTDDREPAVTETHTFEQVCAATIGAAVREPIGHCVENAALWHFAAPLEDSRDAAHRKPQISSRLKRASLRLDCYTSFMRDQIASFIQDQLARDRRDVDVRNGALVESGVIDSLGIMKLLEFIEKELGVRIPDRDLVPENFETLEAITRLIASKDS